MSSKNFPCLNTVSVCRSVLFDSNIPIEKARIVPPYWCPRCQFVWDSVEHFTTHLKYCFPTTGEEKEAKVELEKFAKTIDSFFYEPSNLNHKQNKATKSSDIPNIRCRVKLTSGPREGEYCLRKVKNYPSIDFKRCQYHQD